MKTEEIISSNGNLRSPEAVRPADALADLKGAFLASLNHEIRTPLSGIIGLMSLLGETQLDDEQKEYATAVQKCAAQLLETLNLMLDFSALSTGNVALTETEFSPDRVLESVAAEALIHAKDKNLHFTCHVDDDFPETVLGDALALRQILTQILRNAVKFTESGEVVLKATAGASVGNQVELVVSVSDTGPGIEPEKLDQMFNAFQQGSAGLNRSHSGLGLGLSLADCYCKRMGGTLEAESQVGQGSQFTVRVPFRVAESHVDEPAAAKVPPSTPDGAPRILFVDDNSAARKVVGHTLAAAGFAVECAASAGECLSVAADHQFDLVLMDLQMPGIDGLEATARLRRIRGYEDIPVVALSANYSDESRRHSFQAGLQGFLAKPIERAELVAEVKRFLTGADVPTHLQTSSK